MMIVVLMNGASRAVWPFAGHNNVAHFREAVPLSVHVERLGTEPLCCRTCDGLTHLVVLGRQQSEEYPLRARCLQSPAITFLLCLLASLC